MPSTPMTPNCGSTENCFLWAQKLENVSQGQSIGASTIEAGNQNHHLAMGGDRRMVRDVRNQMRVRGARTVTPRHPAPQSKEPTHRHKAPKYITRRADNTDSKIVPRRPNAPRLWGMGVINTFQWFRP